MKKNIINVLVFALTLGILFSCERNDNFIDKQKTPVNTSSDKKTIIVDGEALYAGYGYDPANDRPFRNAIHSSNVFQTTDIDEPLVVEVATIETHEELSKFVSVGLSVEGDYTYELYTFGGSLKNSIQTKNSIDENHITVIARIKSKRYKYVTDNYPQLTTKAQTLIDNGNFDQFTGNHGVMYVNERVMGGEVYYSYNYDYRKVEKWTKAEFEAKVKAKVANLYGIDVGPTISVEDQQIISKAQVSSSIISSIPGYAPKIVENIADVNEEISKIQSYLASNPEEATTIEMNVRPYYEFLKQPEIKSVFDYQSKCLQHLNAWLILYDNVTFVAESTTDPNMKNKASSALSEISEQIRRSKAYRNSSAPAPNAYEEITERLPFYRYDNRSKIAGRHNQTTSYAELGAEKDGWKYHSFVGYILKNQKPGSKPLYHQYKSTNKGHRFATTPSEDHNWRTVGIIGYVYEKQEPGTVPLYSFYRWPSSYLSITADKTGLFAYKKKGVIGYVYPAY